MGDKGSQVDVWHVISHTNLLDLLRRAAAGENPDLLYLEGYVNSTTVNPLACPRCGSGDVDSDEVTVSEDPWLTEFEMTCRACGHQWARQ